MGTGADRRRTLVVVGPTPPPYHGMSVYTRQLLDSRRLGSAFRVVHLDTADRRSTDNMGRLDLRNIYLGLAHALGLGWILVRHRGAVVYIEVAQNEWAYIRDAVQMGIARLLGARVVTHLHGSHFREFYEGTTRFHRWLVRRSSRWLSAAAVLGEGLRGIYAGLVPESRIHVVPNGVEDLFPGGAPDRGGGGEVVVLYLGTLYRAKGVMDLLRAAAVVVGRVGGQGVRFVFAGGWGSEGERREGLELVASSGLGGVVSFAGVVSGAAKVELLASSDLLVFPGIQAEGLPLVILEAMSAGLPVVTTARGAIGDAVEDGETGLIVPVGDPLALAGAVERLAGDGELRRRLGEAGRARFLAGFTAEGAVGRLVEVLEGVLGE